MQTSGHSALGLAVDQQSATRVRVTITGEVWDGLTELGWIEIDLARALDQRVAITASRLDHSRTGPVEVSVR